MTDHEKRDLSLRIATFTGYPVCRWQGPADE